MTADEIRDLLWERIGRRMRARGLEEPAGYLALLVALEGLLSADNAMVLAVLVLGLASHGWAAGPQEPAAPAAATSPAAPDDPYLWLEEGTGGLGEELLDLPLLGWVHVTVKVVVRLGGGGDDVFDLLFDTEVRAGR